MSLGDDVLRVIPELRAEAESLMVDAGTISRPAAGAGTIDPVTGVFTPAASTLLYPVGGQPGRCRIKKASLTEQAVVFGDTDLTKQRFVAAFPWNVPDVKVGDVVRVPESDDPHIGGREFRVEAVPSSSVLFQREFGVEVVE